MFPFVCFPVVILQIDASNQQLEAVAKQCLMQQPAVETAREKLEKQVRGAMEIFAKNPLTTTYEFEPMDKEDRYFVYVSIRHAGFQRIDGTSRRCTVFYQR